ncbi:MAG: dihydropteroate synthase [Spirochaetaceae bacterium]|jgi:dihydropteroate synthase|nr:dihydropteroate synthase [Spirochaetaceae bacterium]
MNSVGLPGGRSLDLSGAPLIMAIINCNDDSFFAGSRVRGEAAADRALRFLDEGAHIIDFGAESSRPGADYIPAEEEIRRLAPVIASFRKRSDAPVSVDTRKAETGKAVLDAGADIINDISALEDDPSLAALCAKQQAAVVLMHKKGTPRTMQAAPRYDNLVVEVREYLAGAAEKALAAGISGDRVILDPGIGFGKSPHDNCVLIAHLEEIRRSDYPVLVGLSRKSFIGALTGRSVEERLWGTLAAGAAALFYGAGILRVHDVRETADLIAVWKAIAGSKTEGGEYAMG